MTGSSRTSDVDEETQYVALPHAGSFVGRSYATIRKWAAPSSGPILETIADPRDKRVRLARLDDLAKVHVRTNRRGWIRTTQTVTSEEGTITVVVPGRTS